MSGQRRARIVALLVASSAGEPLGRGIAAATRAVLGAAHVGLLLTSGGLTTPVDCDDEVGTILDEQQANLGKGPTLAAASSSTPIVATALAQTSTGRAPWPLFSGVAAELGIGSAVALPLRAGAAQLGVLTAYRSTPTPPDDEQFADGLVLADLVTDLLVGELAGTGSDELRAAIDAGFATQSVVHQAAGMLSEQLGITVIEALVRLRAHATTCGLSLTAVGRSIVSGELELER